MKLSLLWNMRAALSLTPPPPPPDTLCSLYGLWAQGVFRLFNQWTPWQMVISHAGVQWNIQWQPKKKKERQSKIKTKHPWGRVCGETYSTVQWSVRDLKEDKWTVCSVEKTGGWHMIHACSRVFSLFVLYCNYTDETHCKALSLQCSSSLPLSLPRSLQVCDFMYNYLHNYSSLRPTVSGGLFLSRWYRLSLFSWTHIRTHRQHQRWHRADSASLSPGVRTCLITFFCLVSVWCRLVLILERQQSRYSVHEETSGLLLGCHTYLLIIHSDITNLKSLKVCHRE